MKPTAALALPLVIGALAVPADAQLSVGDRMPAVVLEDFANTTAKAFEDFAGRAILLEFFAYW